jgi:hypothetical protein
MTNHLARPNIEQDAIGAVGAVTTSVPSGVSAGGWGDESELICSRLIQQTGYGEVEVGIAVGRALEHFRGARVREFVPLLVERDARRRLRAWHADAVTAIELDARRPSPMGEGGRYGQDDG